MGFGVKFTPHGRSPATALPTNLAFLIRVPNSAQTQTDLRMVCLPLNNVQGAETPPANFKRWKFLGPKSNKITCSQAKAEAELLESDNSAW